MIKQHFQEQFADPTRTPVAPDGLARPLDNPISADELERAFKRLHNRRALGPDDIPAELLKYGATTLAQPLADILNHGFSTGNNIHLGDGILLGLPKPNKPVGQCASLRPIVLLTSIRKAISLVVLRRISPKVERFLSPHQSGFRPCRSTADAVWAHRWIAARAMRYKERFHILGIDLSRAFDIVNRDKLLSVLEDIVDNDELRLIRLLLQDTSLALRFGNTLLSPFESNAGTPQGDSLSPVLFVVYLGAALRDLASKIDVPHDLLADMIVYADDADFICQHADIAKLIEDQAPAVLSNWSLQMNTSKTEHTIVNRCPTACSTKVARKTHEDWRNTRKLGSLLGDAEDLSRRKTLATAALHCMWKVWLRPSKTSEATRVRMYNCYILPILLYNCGTWALTKAELHGLESFHRQQLRKVIGIRYPDWISTDKLYRRTKTEPLRYTLLRSRWRLFGHILRRPANIPAYRFMDAYFRLSTAGKWLGRRRLTLPMVLDADLQTLSIGHRLQRTPDLYLLRLCAQDRKGWKYLVEGLLAHAPTDGH
ncbi:hypothetical protein ON010_g16295 [Phytophthora cinnamomi]|nr:hypothetical protein ON010_g16295 [Phytophthora cinnamomi]